MTCSLLQAHGAEATPPRFAECLSRRAFLKGLGVLGVALALPGCRRALAQPDAQTYVVELKDFYFDPLGLVLSRGDTVIWLEAREQADTRHTATAYHRDFDKQLRIPEDAPAWNSGFFEHANQTWSHTFEAVGIHDYYCIPHEDTGMVGRILVETPTGPGAQPLSVGVSAAGQSVMPFVDELQGAVGEVFNFQGRINAVMVPWRMDDHAQAVEAWEALAAQVEALLPQFLKSLDPEESLMVQEELDAFDAVVGSEVSVFQALAAADELKLFLEQLAYD